MMRRAESAGRRGANVAEDSSDPEISRGELPEGFHGSTGGGKSTGRFFVDQLRCCHEAVI